MKKIFNIIILLFISPVIMGQKKFFFDNIDITFNIHVGDAGIQKESWPDLFKQQPSSYLIDTFQRVDAGTRCIIFPFIPTSVSAGVRVSKNLFSKAEHHLLANRIEWRSGLLTGSKLESTIWLTDRDYSQAPPPVPYRYQDLQLTYRRFWIDFNNQVVYKIPSWLLSKYLKYYLGFGAGFTYEAGSRVSEKLIQYRVTQPGNTDSLIEESNTTKKEKARTVISTYLNITSGVEIKCFEKIYLLFEGNYQGYVHSFSLKKRLYKEGGYLSLIFRYRF